MRPIKFRAWDKKREFMEELSFPWGIINGGIYSIVGGEQWEDATLMQYTGLEDKNGKEIYEGDVVRMRALIFGHFEPMIGYVYYESPSFVVIANEPQDVRGKGRLLDERNLNEIIGNIYENPELAKKDAS